MFGQDIAIDLGTCSTIIYAKDKGIILNEPTIVSYEKTTKKVIAAGNESVRLLGRTAGDIETIKPLKNGVISDFDLCEKMLRIFIKKSLKHMLMRPRMIICLPPGVTDVEERAIQETALSAGARKVYLMEEPFAAAIGANVDIKKANGNLIVDIGGGTTDIAVLSLNGIVISESLRVGGEHFNEAISKFMRKRYGIIIGETTADEVKHAIGQIYFEEGEPDRFYDVRGGSTAGMPMAVTISARELFSSLVDSSQQIVRGVYNVLKDTPPELAGDIYTNGGIMTGGGSLLSGLDKVLSEQLGFPFRIAPDPLLCVALGAGKALDFIPQIEQGDMILTKQRSYGNKK